MLNNVQLLKMQRILSFNSDLPRVVVVDPAQDGLAVPVVRIEFCKLLQSGAETLVVQAGVEVANVYLWGVAGPHVLHDQQQVVLQLPAHGGDLHLDAGQLLRRWVTGGRGGSVHAPLH